MFEVRTTVAFDEWLDRVRDDRAQARIASRIARLSHGHYGDSKSVGGTVTELKID